VGLVVAMTGISALGVEPSAAAAQRRARWSAEHGQLAPQFAGNVARSTSYGNVVRILFPITIAVAIWKPFGSIGHRKPKPVRSDAVRFGSASFQLLNFLRLTRCVLKPADPY
jgi:hypothetical protein